MWCGADIDTASKCFHAEGVDSFAGVRQDDGEQRLGQRDEEEEVDSESSEDVDD